jgi:signal transduction histidine kinase
MTGAAAHEIRTPLSTALMALDLLTSTITSSNLAVSVTENLSEIVDTVKEGCDISLGILNELLTFEKLSVGMMQLEAKLVPLVFHVETNVSMFRFQALQKGINFYDDISPEERGDFKDLMVFVDEHKMGQVARNLLSNALKFTSAGGFIRITMSVEKNLGALSSSGHQHHPSWLEHFFRSEHDTTASSARQAQTTTVIVEKGSHSVHLVDRVEEGLVGNEVGVPKDVHIRSESISRVPVHSFRDEQSGHSVITEKMHSSPRPRPAAAPSRAVSCFGFCGGCCHHNAVGLIGEISSKYSAKYSLKTKHFHHSEQVMPLVFQELPDVEPYGFVTISVVDSGAGIDKVCCSLFLMIYAQVSLTHFVFVLLFV